MEVVNIVQILDYSIKLAKPEEKEESEEWIFPTEV